jgi:hypothetical protein
MHDAPPQSLSPEHDDSVRSVDVHHYFQKIPTISGLNFGSESGTRTRLHTNPSPSLDILPGERPNESQQEFKVGNNNIESNTTLAQTLTMLMEAQMSTTRAIEAIQAENMALRREVEKLASHVTRAESPNASSLPHPTQSSQTFVPSQHPAYYPPPPPHGYVQHPYYAHPPYYPPPPHAHSTEVKRLSETLPEHNTSSSTAL